MGLFSYNCRGCGHPMLGPGAFYRGINDWMHDVVALSKSDPDYPMHGQYDGYGRIGGHGLDDDLDYDTAWWHEACWEVAGKPGYDEPSSGAADQGYFFDREHDVLDPRETYPPGELARRQNQREVARCRRDRERLLRDAFEAWLDASDVHPECGGCLKREAVAADRRARWDAVRTAHGFDIPDGAAYRAFCALPDAEKDRLNRLARALQERLLAAEGRLPVYQAPTLRVGAPRPEKGAESPFLTVDYGALELRVLAALPAVGL